MSLRYPLCYFQCSSTLRYPPTPSAGRSQNPNGNRGASAETRKQQPREGKIEIDASLGTGSASPGGGTTNWTPRSAAQTESKDSFDFLLDFSLHFSDFSLVFFDFSPDFFLPLSCPCLLHPSTPWWLLCHHCPQVVYDSNGRTSVVVPEAVEEQADNALLDGVEAGSDELHGGGLHVLLFSFDLV
jgi:hypothetical protein